MRRQEGLTQEADKTSSIDEDRDSFPDSFPDADSFHDLDSMPDADGPPDMEGIQDTDGIQDGLPDGILDDLQDAEGFPDDLDELVTVDATGIYNEEDAEVGSE